VSKPFISHAVLLTSEVPMNICRVVCGELFSAIICLVASIFSQYMHDMQFFSWHLASEHQQNDRLDFKRVTNSVRISEEDNLK
jgi:hypothetical protein